MGPALTLHLLAGLGALGMGTSVLARDALRARNRQFALLCGALALWNLGIVGAALAPDSMASSIRPLYLLGSCAAAPLGLHFALVLSGTTIGRRRMLVPAYLLAVAVWVVAWTPLSRARWSLLAAAVLGSILGLALVVLGRQARSLVPGPERRASHLVFGGALLAVAGGLTDLFPLGSPTPLGISPLTQLVFLLVLCSVVVRYRFLDVDVFLARAVALGAGAAMMAWIFHSVVPRWGGGYTVAFLTSLAVLAGAGPLGRVILSGARSLFRPDDPIATSLLDVSRRIPRARSTEEIWNIVEEARSAFPGQLTLVVYFGRQERGRYEPVVATHLPRGVEIGSVPRDRPLPVLLDAERLPLTRRFLVQESREAPVERRRLVVRVLDEIDGTGLTLIAPLLEGDRLTGWIGVGGSVDERHLTGDVGTAFMGVGQQVVASLDRLSALEEARRREALAVVGELAAGLAHEVRNPVAAIRGAGQALGPAASDAQREEMLEVIAEESARLDRVVAEFLDYARPTSPNVRPVNVEAIGRRGIRSLELAGRKLSVSLHADPGLQVLADPDQLMRAFENLLRNTWEATGDGGRVRIEAHRETTGRIAIRFEDDGPGIPADGIPRIFTPFHTTRAEGTGLGLALIHRIVEAHGGEVRVEGRPGLGAAFTLVLPEAGESSGGRGA